MTTVLIAVDATEASRHAAESARGLIGDDAEYLAINVARDPGTWTGAGVMPAWGSVYAYPPMTARAPESVTGPDAGDSVENARRRAEHVATEAGVDATPIGSVGDASDAILTAAREHDVDVIVVGSHERGWFRSLLQSSVADEVLGSGSVPVLVVPTDDGG